MDPMMQMLMSGGGGMGMPPGMGGGMPPGSGGPPMMPSPMQGGGVPPGMDPSAGGGQGSLLQMLQAPPQVAPAGIDPSVLMSVIQALSGGGLTKAPETTTM